MNPSITITMIAITALITISLNSVQSESTRHKRWTFNSWRLHGGRHTSHTPSLTLNTDAYSPTILSADVNNQDQLLNVDDDNDGDAFKTLTRQLRFYQVLGLVHKRKKQSF